MVKQRLMVALWATLLSLAMPLSIAGNTYTTLHYTPQIQPSEFKAQFQANQPVFIAIVGDSTTGGFGANPGPNVWSGNGLPYGCMNNPVFGPNLDSTDPLYINTEGFPSQSQQDNVLIPSGTRLLRTYVESRNLFSKVYNYGGSGFTAGTHVSENTIATIAALTPKPQLVFLALGINSAKNNNEQDTDIRTLVAQVLANNMLPVLVKEHNIGVAGDPPGQWSSTATPDEWYPMSFWSSIRANIDIIAADNGLEVIDLGTPDGYLDVTLLYDPFHPSNLGYEVIYQRYRIESI